MSEPNRPFSSGAALLLLLVYYGASALVLLIGDVLSDEQVGVMFFAAAAAIAPLAATYVGLVRHAPNESTAAALRLEVPRRRMWLHLLIGVAVGVALAPLFTEVTTRLYELLPKDQSDDRLSELLAPAIQPATMVLLYLQAVTRELWLRGLVLPRLVASEGLGSAIALVSFFDLSTQPFGVGVVGAVPIAFLALASRSTWPGIVATLTVLFIPEGLMPARTPTLLVGSAALAVALVFVAWRLRQPEPLQPA